MQIEGFQRPEDRICGARLLSGRIDVLDPEQPLAVVLPGMDKARGGREQRSQMQGARRGRGESTDVGAGFSAWTRYR